MKTTKPVSFTPGPWVVAYGSVYREDTLNDESSIRIALMDRNEPHTTPCERDSNARLIAASPCLLQACEQVLLASEDNGDMEDIDWNGLRAAVAKAIGGQP